MKKGNCPREEVTVRLHPNVLKWLDSFVSGSSCIDRSDVALTAIISAYNRDFIRKAAEDLKVPISTAYAMLSPFGFVNAATVRQCCALLKQIAPETEVSSDA